MKYPHLQEQDVLAAAYIAAELATEDPEEVCQYLQLLFDTLDELGFRQRGDEEIFFLASKAFWQYLDKGEK